MAQSARIVCHIAAWAAICLTCTRVLGAEPRALESYYDNTLVCQDHATRAVCRAWFNRDGRYYVFYDLGPQSRPASIDGPFEFEGLEGTYSIRTQPRGIALCLHPIAPPVPPAAQSARELFSEDACYAIRPHALGASWQQAVRGRRFTLWLMAGR